MRKTLFILIALMMIPFFGRAQDYDALWKQAKEAAKKDQPRTQISVLDKIVAKASKEKAYGQLLAATLRRANVEYEVAPDSLPPRLKELEEAETRTSDLALQAVYDAVLSAVYAAHPNLEGSEAKGKEYKEKALAHPDLLARTDASGYTPFVEKGVDSQIFGNDLLHVVGMETDNRQLLHDWYKSHGNREAACLLATDLAAGNVQRLDSVISEYGDLSVCGHAAIARYRTMPAGTNEQRRACYDFLNLSLDRWGTWKEMDLLRNTLQSLTQPAFYARMESQVLHPLQQTKVYFNSVCNLPTVQVRITRTDFNGDDKAFQTYSRINDDRYKRIKPHLDMASAQTLSVDFPNKAPYERSEDSLLLPRLAAGIYLVEILTDNKDVEVKRQLIAVSNLRVLWQEQPNKEIRYAIVRADNGQPVPGATLRLSVGPNGNTKTVTQTANSRGEIFYHYTDDTQKPYDFYAYTSQDKALPTNNCWSYFTYDPQEETEQNVRIFTDRSIYRPGQTVRVNVMAWTVMGTETKATANETLTLTLRDANWREVETKTLTTDAFGAASTEFQLPSSGLTGRFSLYENLAHTSADFQVEEYKRPTFEVSFDEYDKPYVPGDTITVKGLARTYSGMPIEGANVRYTVVRRPVLWWRWWLDNSGETEVYSGVAKTDEEGHFEAEVPLTLDDNMEGFYHFDVRADVTDLSGESHEGTTSIPVGRKSALLSTDLKDKILDTETPSFTLQYRNAAGKNVEGSVSYGFFPTDGKLTDEVMAAQLTKTAAANSQIELPKLKSGQWTLFARCGSDTLRFDFIVFSLNDKKPVVETHDWFYQSGYMFPRDGQPVSIQVGSSDEDQHIVYSVIAGDKVLENGIIDQSNALTLKKFTYKKAYGDGLRLNFAWVHDGVTYKHSTTIARPLPEKELKLTWRTFRDRLSPGQEEEWTLEVRNPDGTPANAQFIATLYDKSLDQLQLHRWSDALNFNLAIPRADWYNNNFEEIWINCAAYYAPLNVKHLSLAQFDRYYYEILLEDLDNVRLYRDFNSGNPRIRFKQARLAAAPMASVNNVEADASDRGLAFESNDLSLEECVVVNDSMAKPAGQADASANEKGTNQPVQLRENLQETAFFYPQLRTDETGAVTMKFRLPESVTTWRLMGLAHDKEMRHGLITADVVAQKDIMVQPNLPRFVREGDQAVVSARISNTTDTPKQGVARLQLLNPDDESVVFEQEQPFATDGNKTVSVSFSIAAAALEGHEGLLIARIFAQGDGFNDGEQHYLPVLTNKEYVTTTLPFSQNEPGTMRLDIARLFQGGGIERPQLTVEYTNNPAWLMIQALPYVGDANEKNAISLTAAVYANTLGSYIVGQNPRLKTVFKQWQQETGTETSLQSQLEKDEQLKQLVLTETPWVSNAQSETAQRRTLATYFDENQLAQTQSRALTGLQKLQLNDGSFAWWEGMQGSFPMTIAVVKMLTRLQAMTGQDKTLNAITTQAFRYLDREVAKRVAELKKMEKEGVKDLFPSDDLCDYLYTNALAKRSRTDDTDYLLRLLSRRPSVLSIYGKANTAVILAQYGYTQKAKEYLKSLKEFTVYHEETGRYFDTPRALYSWRNYRIPTEVAAIEAIRQLTPEDTQTIQEMQRWLLQEKRTQAWDSPIDAADAIWAFANGGQIGQLTQNGDASRLAIDGKPIEEKATAGLGYIRHTEQVNTIPQTLIAEKTSTGISWGAAYAQYLQPMTEVQSSTSGISVRRELLDKDGKALSGAPQVGDRVRVRITIEADRDYDFVMVNDKRAACLEPVTQHSGYRWGYYLETCDQATRYFFDQMNKGKHVVETEYYIDREGSYQSGTCTVQCAYAPEYSGRTACEVLKITK